MECDGVCAEAQRHGYRDIPSRVLPIAQNLVLAEPAGQFCQSCSCRTAWVAVYVTFRCDTLRSMSDDVMTGAFALVSKRFHAFAQPHIASAAFANKKAKHINNSISSISSTNSNSDDGHEHERSDEAASADVTVPGDVDGATGHNHLHQQHSVVAAPWYTSTGMIEPFAVGAYLSEYA